LKNYASLITNIHWQPGTILAVIKTKKAAGIAAFLMK